MNPRAPRERKAGTINDAGVEAVAEVLRTRFFCRLQSNRDVSDHDREVAEQAIRAYHAAMAAPRELRRSIKRET